jgi:hypothetical protein
LRPAVADEALAKLHALRPPPAYRARVHFRSADVQGAMLGRKVADWLQHHRFQPVDQKHDFQPIK